MTDNERDTHFAGAAKLLHDRLQEIQRVVLSKGRTSEPIPVLQQRAIANFAYDLVKHTLDHDMIELSDMESEEVIRDHIPDLTKWADSPNSE